VSENKKYYYMKLKDNFFDSEEMKILESMPSGVEYQNLYLKMCLLSLKSNGALLFKEIMPYDLQMLSTVTRIKIDVVKNAIEIFQKIGLVSIVDSETIYMSDIQSLVGRSSTEADRIAQYRERTKSVQMYENCTPELDIRVRVRDQSIDNNTKSHSPSGGDDNALVLHKPNSTSKKEPKRTEEEKTIFASIWQQTVKDHGIELIKSQSGREAKACWDLVDLSRKQFAQDAFDGVSSIITSFLDKKRNDRTTGGFWRDKSPRPSTILAMWPDLLETIREKTMTPEEQDLLREMTEAMTKYDRR
jgi:predicted phage replisome organizer